MEGLDSPEEVTASVVYFKHCSRGRRVLNPMN